MTHEDRRRIKAMALLECEEARENLALLRAKADQMRVALDQVKRLLVLAKREHEDRKEAHAYARSALQERREELLVALDVDAALALDYELKEADERLRCAVQRRKELGLGE